MWAHTLVLHQNFNITDLYTMFRQIFQRVLESQIPLLLMYITCDIAILIGTIGKEWFSKWYHSYVDHM